MKRVKEADWVGLRTLYLLLASDTSAGTSAEVKKILKYYDDKYTKEGVQKAMGMLVKDNAIHETFTSPTADFARKLDRSITILHKDPDFPERVITIL